MNTAELEEKMLQILTRWMANSTAGAVVEQRVAHPVEEYVDTAAPLENFSGIDEDLSVMEWIDRLELARDVGGWSEATTRSVLLDKLTGQARSWHLNSGNSLATYDEWKAKFLERFGPRQRERALVDDLKGRIEKGGNPLQMYIWRSTLIAVQLGMSPEDAKGQILHHLQPEYSSLIEELHDRKHSDIPDLLRDIERSIKFRQSLLSTLRVPDTPYEIRLWWQPASNGNVPKMAFLAGVDTNGEDLYIARAFHNGDLIPGKLVPSHTVAYVAYAGRENAHRDYEVLVCERLLEWVSCTGSGPLPSGAIQGGRTEDGEPLYIARAPHEGSVTPGKFQQSKKACYISWGGRAHRYEEFMVLTYGSIDLD